MMGWARRSWCRLVHRDRAHVCWAWWDCRFVRSSSEAAWMLDPTEGHR